MAPASAKKAAIAAVTSGSDGADSEEKEHSDSEGHSDSEKVYPEQWVRDMHTPFHGLPGEDNHSTPLDR